MDYLTLKFSLLEKLKANFIQMQDYLAYGDSDAATRTCIDNFRIVEALEKVDTRVVVPEDRRKSLIYLLQELVALQESCQVVLEKSASDFRRELNVDLIKRQLKLYLYQN